MKTYIYQADIYCAECGEKIKKTLSGQLSNKSDNYPQGPYGVSEADYPQHCADCGLFLENPLTTDGEDYIKEYIYIANNPDNETIKQWIKFYDCLK